MTFPATHEATTILSPRRRWASLGVLTLAVLLLAVDGTVLYLAVPSLTRDLEPTATEILWIGDIYSLVLAGLLVAMGSLADRVGRKKMLLVGATAFGAASLMAALSTSATMLIAARFLLGIAGATLMPSTLSLIRNIFTDPLERTRAIAIWSAAAGGGAAIGPLIGGVLLEHFGWGSVFLINVPVMIVLIVSGFFLLPESKDPNPGRFDLPSAVLSMLAIIPVVFAIKHAVTAGPDVTMGVALGAGVLFGFVFIRRQRRLDTPLIDVDLFRRPAFSGAVFAGFLAIFALTGLLYFFSQYLQLARGFSPLQAGLAELPTTLSSIVVIAVVGLALRHVGRGRAIAGGLALVTVGLVLVAAAEGADHYVWLALSLIPVGLGVGLAQTITTDAIVSAVPPHKAGAASAISETAFELGNALGIAILGSVMSLLYRSRLTVPDGLTTEQVRAVHDSLAAASAALDPGSPALVLAQHSFTTAMQITAIIAAAITLLGAVVAWKTIPSPRIWATTGEKPGH